MPEINAERQRDHRHRRAHRIAALQARCATLEAERDRLQADLDTAHAEVQRRPQPRLGLTGTPEDQRLPDGAAWGRGPAGTTLDKGAPLFPRLEG